MDRVERPHRQTREWNRKVSVILTAGVIAEKSRD
jgi:hypothetical protein